MATFAELLRRLRKDAGLSQDRTGGESRHAQVRAHKAGSGNAQADVGVCPGDRPRTRC